MQDVTEPTRDDVRALATSALRPRSRPYRGDTAFASIAALDPTDAALIRDLYRFLEALYQAVQPVDVAAADVAAVRDRLAALDHGGLVERLGRLGAALTADSTPLAVRKAYHDIRGGSLPGLLMHLDVVAAGEGTGNDVERVFVLVRDHLKIMRNALPDLDPDGHARDLSPREHDVSLLVRKWADAHYGPGEGRRVTVRLRCEFVGGVSECCMEFAALDRVLYNLINNAARFAADDEVQIHVLPLADAPETDLRIAVCNRITPAHRERLLADLGRDCSRVFSGGYTTGGHGVGLQICGDIITHGYGLSSLREALAGGYLGARLVHDHFVAWFHWPARRGDRDRAG